MPPTDRHAPAGELGELEAVSGQRVPAQHRHGACLVEGGVGQRLELCGQDVAVLGSEREFVEVFGDRLAVEPGERGERSSRVVGYR